MFTTKRKPICVAVAIVAASGHGELYANSEGDDLIFEEIVVTAQSRLPENLDSFPGSVTLVSEETLENLRQVSNDISIMLGQSVPGLGAGSAGTASNFEQSLRGRIPAILIDGIPIGTPLRDGRHDVRSLSASSLETIEVIRGSTALYGNGGAGGVINYITKTSNNEQPRTQLDLGTSMSLTHAGDSYSPTIDLSAVGKLGGVDYNASVFTEETGGQFDADGDRIHPDPNGQGGMADSSVTNIFFKLGHSWGNHRIEGSVLKYEQEPDSDYNGIIRGDAAAGIKTRPFKEELDPRAILSSNKNELYNLIYTHNEVLGGTFKALAFYQEYENVFSFSDFFPDDGQSAIFAEKNGLRFDLNTPLSFLEGANLLWGFDYVEDKTRQDVLNKGLGANSVRIWAPEVTQESAAIFAQASLPLTDNILLQGGVRRDQIDVSFPGFTALFSGVSVQKGKTDYDATTYNAGLNYQFNDIVSMYVAYSEGFSTAEVGRVLRQADETTDFANADIEASIVENYEVGVRIDYSDYHTDIVVFQSDSNLGTSITSDLMISRAKEEIHGVEISFGGTITDQLDFGGSFTYVNGEKDSDGNGSVDRKLGSNRTPPAKVTAWLAYEVNQDISGRLHILHSADRDEFSEVRGFAEAEIDSYTIVDLSASYRINENNRVSAGIHNLFNEDYFTLASQFFNDDTKNSKGPGRSLKLNYSYTF